MTSQELASIKTRLDEAASDWQLAEPDGALSKLYLTVSADQQLARLDERRKSLVRDLKATLEWAEAVARERDEAQTALARTRQELEWTADLARTYREDAERAGL